jgi:AbiV family abortive infection protein
MRVYSADELMLAERKKAESLRPRPGEIVQGIFFALFTSHHHLKAAELLLGDGNALSGYGQLINAIEELGKVKPLANILVNWMEPHKAEQFKNQQKNHEAKIEFALQMFQAILSKSDASIRISSAIEDTKSGSEAVECVLRLVDPDAAESYHKLRLITQYSNFDGKRVESPFYHAHKISGDGCLFIASSLRKALDKVFEFCSKFLPIFFDPIRECFYCIEQKKIGPSKFEINRRIERTLPAMRKHLDTWLEANTGLDIEKWSELPDGKRVIPKLPQEDIAEHVRSIARLITGSEEIELVYFYPPLKDSAKLYYSSFTP